METFIGLGGGLKPLKKPRAPFHYLKGKMGLFVIFLPYFDSTPWVCKSSHY
jgi:hypothetical protein